MSGTWHEGNKCWAELTGSSEWLKGSTQTVLMKSYYQGQVSTSGHKMITDLPGYVSKKPPSAVLSHGLQPLQTAHIVWHPRVGVLSGVWPFGVSVFRAGYRTRHSEGQAEPPAAELGKHPRSSEKRVKSIITKEGKHWAAKKTNKIKTATKNGKSSTGTSPPVLRLTLTYMKLSKLALVQHFSKLCHCVILTFNHLVQLLGLKMRQGVPSMLVN